MIHIRNFNTKIGKTSNISLPPVKACFDRPCHNECYAIKFYIMYPDVKKAWDDNLYEAQNNRKKYFITIRRYLLKKNPEYFRWHVSGDILDQNYLEQMKTIARDYYFINFVVFTKGYHLDFNNAPNNLSIILSAWPGIKLPKSKFPLAFVKTKKEDRIFNSLDCPGECEKCRICWNLKNKNITFKKH